MTQIELEGLYITTEHGTFTPNYTYDDYIIERDEAYYVNLIIHKMAQQVYDEWLYNKDKSPTEVPTTEEQIQALEKENAQLWDTVEFLLKEQGYIPREDVTI